MFPQLGTEMGKMLPSPGSKARDAMNFVARLSRRELWDTTNARGKKALWRNDAHDVEDINSEDGERGILHAPFQQNTRWFRTAESADKSIKTLKDQLLRRSRAFGPSELDAVFQDYVERREAKSLGRAAERWDCLFELSFIVSHHPQWSKVRYAQEEGAVARRE